VARVSGTGNAHRRWLQRLVRAQARLWKTNSHKESLEQLAGRAATFAPKEAQPAAFKMSHRTHTEIKLSRPSPD
jgi:hypothetical protein